MVPPLVRRAAPVAVLVLLASGIAACGSGDTDGPATLAPTTTLAGVVRAPLLEVADVSLPEASSGTPMAMRADDGELLVVYFGYTSCPDVCPMTMSDLRVAIDDLPEELADKVTVAMATVDPERDQPEVLSQYLRHFFDRTAALRTDDPDELAAAAEAFGVQYEVEAHEPGDATYDVGHSAITYVVDDSGTVRVEWPFGFESEHMTTDLTALLTRPEIR